MTPTGVPPDDPRSHYSQALSIAEERKGFSPNQYENINNPEAHYKTTGPEIWEQTNGKLDAFVAGMGRFLKEKNPKIKIIGVDPEGPMIHTAFYKKAHHVHPYLVEGIGEGIIPKTLDMGVIDEIIRVNDRDSFLMTRELVRKEGLIVGGSSGAAVLGALQVARRMKRGTIVVILPDSGRSYLSKIFSDEWRREKGFM